MSEISSYETTISIPSLAQRTSLTGVLLDQEPRAALLKRALELLAEDHKGKVVSQIQDCDGKTIPCLLGVTTPELPWGLGVVVESNGQLSFVYDAHGDVQGWGQRLAGEFQANYNALAVRQALQAMNLKVEKVQKTQKDGRHFLVVSGKA
jgi:hypothetical protein